jgi:hypothetical protein
MQNPQIGSADFALEKRRGKMKKISRNMLPI